MNNPDHISDSLETIFWVTILQFFDADPGWKKFGSGIRDGKNSDLGSGINIPDPQHCSHTKAQTECGLFWGIKPRSESTAETKREAFLYAEIIF
jgi:hypothetical protein